MPTKIETPSPRTRRQFRVGAPGGIRRSKRARGEPPSTTPASSTPSEPTCPQPRTSFSQSIGSPTPPPVQPPHNQPRRRESTPFPRPPSVDSMEGLYATPRNDQGPPDDDDGSSSEEEPTPEPAPPPPRSQTPAQSQSDTLLISALTRIANGLQPRNNEDSVKARRPDTFDGTKPESVETFLTQCRLYFRANPTRYRSSAAKVNFATTYLQGAALQWFEVAIADEDRGVYHDYAIEWEAFVRELRRCFRIANPEDEAADELERLTMRHLNHITEYNVQFIRLAAKLPWNEPWLCRRFYNGLPDRIKEVFTYREGGKPKTLPALQNASAEIDTRFWERQREKTRGKEDTSTTKKPQHQSTPAPSHHNTDTITIGRSTPQAPTNKGHQSQS